MAVAQLGPMRPWIHQPLPSASRSGGAGGDDGGSKEQGEKGRRGPGYAGPERSLPCNQCACCGPDSAWPPPDAGGSGGCEGGSAAVARHLGSSCGCSKGETGAVRAGRSVPLNRLRVEPVPGWPCGWAQGTPPRWAGMARLPLPRRLGRWSAAPIPAPLP